MNESKYNNAQAMCLPKCAMLKDRDYDVTPHIIAHMYPQMRGGSVKDCEVDMGDGRRRVRGVL